MVENLLSSGGSWLVLWLGRTDPYHPGSLPLQPDLAVSQP